MSGPLLPAVVGLLRHLETLGFDGAPRVVGDGPEVAFVPGQSPHPHAWADDRLADVGDLLRRAHDAASSYAPPAEARWKPWWLREVGPHDDLVVGHGDAAPWNTLVTPTGRLVLIDWEYAGPTDRLTDLAYAAWLQAQLHDDDVAERQGLPDAATRAGHLSSMLDGYRLERSRRTELVDRMVAVAVHAARHEVVDGVVTEDTTEAVDADGYPVTWAIAWRVRSASWMLRNRDLLVRSAVG